MHQAKLINGAQLLLTQTPSMTHNYCPQWNSKIGAIRWRRCRET